jgi:tetratricopeptide (TPR) repeat protein
MNFDTRGAGRRHAAGRLRARVQAVVAAAVCTLLVLPVVAQPAGRGSAAEAFDRGLTALHNFEYEQANDAFREARRLDPGLALAYWGEALTYWQVLAALGPTAAARSAKARTPRDKVLLGAADQLFGDGDANARHRRYTDAMRAAAARYPDDPDVVSLYALALLGSSSRSLIGFGDAHDERLAGSALQKEVGALLTQVLASHPRHPGALHYLLHAYDDPQHAALALDAARTYARVANGASHALHMPAHVFLQLGLWHDAAASDRAAYDASNAWVRQKQRPLALRNYHALAWLQYELLQLGRFAEARATIAEIEPVATASARGAAPADVHQPLLSDLSSMRARYVIETRRWDVMANETQFGNVNDLFTIGMSAAKKGNVRAAQMVQQALAQRAVAPQEGDLRPAIAIMEREMAALVELANGRPEYAIEILKSAARSELDLPAPLGLPLPIKPAPELLGEVLLDAGRPREAMPQFEAVLRLHANRSLSVLGLARAAAAAANAAVARQHYQQLLKNYDRADAGLPELKEARTALARAP